MIYDDDMIKQISDNVDLLEYVSQSIDLTKRNKDYFGRCPLHIDKTPSFSVTPSKNCFFCFGCGRGGGIIQYLTEYEGLSYDDSVNKAAQLAQVDISKMCRSETMTWLTNLKKTVKAKKEVFKHIILPNNTLDTYLRQAPQEWIDEGISTSSRAVLIMIMSRFGKSRTSSNDLEYSNKLSNSLTSALKILLSISNAPFWYSKPSIVISSNCSRPSENTLSFSLKS